MKRIILSAVALTIAATVPALSQTYRTERRDENQYWRIERGAARGDLTPHELKALRWQQSRIDWAQRRAARDGVITRKEARRLEQLQDRASQVIRDKTYNDRGVW
jgi:hypothetical protein